MTRRKFFSTTTAGLSAALAGGAAPAKPNIILILADDLGYGDCGCYGQQRIATPTIDRLASEGVRFTQAYAGSTVCAPSRCCLETGYHTGHARVRGNRYPNLPLLPETPTLGRTLKQAGYRTGIIGKWALGQLGSTGYPLEQGYDEFFGYFSQTHAHNYYPEHLLDGRGAYLLRGNMGCSRCGDYAPDLFIERALQFLRRDDQHPFFLYFSTTIPHANNERGRDTGDGMEIPDYGPYAAKNWPDPEKAFAAMVTRLDHDIERIVETLRETGKDRDTLIVFTSDNGPHREGGHSPDFFDSNGPLRGIKRDLYEGGIRVPAVAWWPGRIQGGRVSDHPWAFWDLLPTFAELAGVRAPRGIDGISIVPELVGKPQPKHDYLYWEFHGRRFRNAVRFGDWKAIAQGLGGPVELYNLAEDLGEAHDLARANPGLVRKARELLATARTESKEWPVKKTA